jgi:hypothetical protein
MGNIAARNQVNADLFRGKESVGIVIIRACGHDFWRCSRDVGAPKGNPLMIAVLESHTVTLKRDDYWILAPR